MDLNRFLKPAQEQQEQPVDDLNKLLKPAGRQLEEEMLLQDYLTPTPELRANVARRKEGLLAKGLRVIGGFFEPVFLVSDTFRALIYDTFYRQPDEESQLAVVWRNIPRYAPWGASPEEVVSFRDILRDKYGVEGAQASFWGTLLDIALDPTVLVAGWGKAANIAARAAAKDALKLGIDVARIRASDLARIIERMEPGPIKEQLEVALKIKRKPELFTPAGFVEAVVPESVRTSIQKSVIDYADQLPYFKRIRQRKIVTEDIPPGAPIDEGKRYRLGTESVEEPFAKSVLPESTYWALKTAGTPHEKVAKRIHGVYDVLSPGRPDLQVGLKNEADFLAKRIRSIGEYATVDLHNTIKQAFGRSPKEIPHFYAEFDRALGQLIDNLGPGNAAELAIRIKDAHSLEDAIKLLPNYKLGNAEAYKKTVERLKRLARAYGLKEDAVEQAVQRGLRIAWATHALMGYYLSGMYKLDEVIGEVTPKVKELLDKTLVGWSRPLDRSPEEIKAAVYQALFDAAKGKPLNPERAQIVNLIKSEWEKRGYSDLFAVSFDDYLKSLDEGYLRRIVPLRDASQEDFVKQVYEAMDRGVRWFRAKELDATDLVEEVRRTFGNEAADKLAAHLAVRGDGAINTLELADIIGAPLPKLLRVLDKLEVTPIELDERVLKALDDVLGESRRAVANIELGFQKWQERKLPEHKLVAEFLGLAGATERMAAYTSAAARTIKAERFIQEAYQELKNLGLLLDEPSELRFASGDRLIDDYGIDYIRIPNHPDLWGPLAGKYVPRYVAEPMLNALELGEPALWQEALQTWRALALSSPSTVVMNIGGGINALMRLGMKPNEVIKYMRDAYRDLAEINKGKAMSVLGEGWDKLNLYAKGKLYGEAIEEFDQALITTLGEIVKPDGAATRLINRLQQVRRALATKKWSPLLWFERSEDAMRLAYFKWLRDRLVRGGLDVKRAAELAAANANASLFNYAEQPLLMNTAKKYGLMLFPAFGYYNISRTARMLAETPAALSVPAHVYEGIVDAALGSDPQEKLRWKLMLYGTYLENAAPLPFRLGDQMYAILLSQFFPEMATEPGSIVEELATGGILRPAISMLYSIFTGENPPWEAKYGKRYVQPTDLTLLDRLVSSTRQAAYDLMPTPLKKAYKLGDAVRRKALGKDDDVFFMLYGRDFSPSVAEALTNFVINARQVDVQYGQRARRWQTIECMNRFRSAVYHAQRLRAAGEDEKAKRIIEKAVLDRVRCVEKVWR